MARTRAGITIQTVIQEINKTPYFYSREALCTNTLQEVTGYELVLVLESALIYMMFLFITYTNNILNTLI